MDQNQNTVAMEWKEDTHSKAKKVLVEWKDVWEQNSEVAQEVRKEQELSHMMTVIEYIIPSL